WRMAGDFDVIHAHSPYVFSTLVALMAARHHQKPFILSPHEGLTRFDRGKASLKTLIWLKEIFAEKYYARANAIIFASDLEERDSVNGRGKNGRAVNGKSAQKRTNRNKNQAKLYNLPLPVGVKNDLHQNTAKIDANAPIQIGYLGRIDAKKNLPILINALSVAVNRFDAKLHLTVAGGGDQELLRQIQHQAGSHNLQAHITWLGFINQAAREKFLADIDILVVPSVFESFGLVAAEAMAAWVPVMASPTVGVADDITKYQAGIVVPPRADALAVALRRLNRDELAIWGRAAHKLVSEKYAHATIGQGLRRIYQELVT
ncbi:MAG: glycosyltransferase family 4 protein, partial [Alphaproteobacteria bacterium]|nr:glycosyltransferase family 4 protein [Alphaproteobacteria bacterium]